MAVILLLELLFVAAVGMVSKAVMGKMEALDLVVERKVAAQVVRIVIPEELGLRTVVMAQAEVHIPAVVVAELPLMGNMPPVVTKQVTEVQERNLAYPELR